MCVWGADCGGCRDLSEEDPDLQGFKERNFQLEQRPRSQPGNRCMFNSTFLIADHRKLLALVWEETPPNASRDSLFFPE